VKKCIRCNKSKSINQYSKKRKRKDGTVVLQSWCKTCHKIYVDNYYIEHRAKFIKKAKERNQKLIISFRKLKETNPCMDCKIKYPYYVMQFDHRPGTKKLTSSMFRYLLTTSNKKFLEEIQKCDLVCGNCHSIRTHTRLH
jgi:hypothetical protein